MTSTTVDSERLLRDVADHLSAAATVRIIGTNGGPHKKPDVMVGRGVVTPSWVDEGRLTVGENGVWVSEPNRGLEFRNEVVWDFSTERVALSHLRYGSETKLVDLQPAGAESLESVAPYLCGRDRYTAVVDLTESGVSLRWTVEGPRKRQKIVLDYR